MPFHSHHPEIAIPTEESIWSFFFQTHDPQGSYTDARTRTSIPYSEVKRQSTQLSTALHTYHDLEPGNVVAIFSPNSIYYPVAMFATLRLGGVISSASPAYNVQEMSYALRVSGARFVFTQTMCLDVVVEAARTVGLTRDKIFLLEGEVDGFRGLKELVRLGQEVETQVKEMRVGEKGNGNVCAFLSFSSGTTGLPKAVMISHQNVIAQCLQMRQITPELKRILAVLPLFHITGLVHILHLPLLLDAKVIMLPSFTMKSMLDAITQHQIHEVLLVPPLLIRMIRDPLVDSYDLSCIRRFSSGAAPLSQEVLQVLKTRFPGTGFKQGYGMTESCSCITAHPPTHYSYDYAHTVGTIVANTTVKIVKENGVEAGIHEAGEIWAKGPQVVMGYLDNENATQNTFDKQGYLHTGDQGSIDENGLVTILDRIKEMIKVKGIAVAPAELEDLLLGHSKVEDVAVLGISDDYSGELPKAYVVPKSGVLKEGGDQAQTEALGRELIEYVRDKKVRHKHVKEIEFIDVIPKSPSGKILRRVLRDKARSAERGVVVRDVGKEKAML